MDSQEPSTSSPAVQEASDSLRKQGPQCIWSDKKDGFQSLLRETSSEEQSEIVTQGTMNGVNVFATAAVPLNQIPAEAQEPAALLKTGCMLTRSADGSREPTTILPLD